MNPRIIEKTTIIKDVLPSASSTGGNAKPFIVRIPHLQTKSAHPLETNKVFIVKTNPAGPASNAAPPTVSLAAPPASGTKFSVVKLADGQLVLVPTAATPTTTTTNQPLVINENSISRIIRASSTSPPNPTGVISTIKRVTKESPTPARISSIQITNLSSSPTSFKSASAQDRRLRAIAPAPSSFAAATNELLSSLLHQQQQLNAASAENLLRFDPTASVLLGEEDSLPVISETVTLDSNGSSLKNLPNHKRKLESLPIEQKTSLPVVASVPTTPVEPPAPPKPKTPVRKTSNPEVKTKTPSTKKVPTKPTNVPSNSITPVVRPSAEQKKALVPTTPTPKIDPEEGIRMKICETILRSLIGKIEREQNQESIKTRLEKHSTAAPKHEHRQIILTRLLNERVDHLRQEFLKNRQQRKTALVKEQFEVQRQKQQELFLKQQQPPGAVMSKSTLNLSEEDDDDDEDEEETPEERSASPPTKKVKRTSIKIKKFVSPRLDASFSPSSLPAKRTRPLPSTRVNDDETPVKKIRRQRQPSENNDENLHRRSSTKNKPKLFSTVNQIVQRKGNKFSGDFHPSNLDCRCRRNDDLQEKFFVQCELCSRWLHGKCAGLTPRLAERMSEFICEDCARLTARAKERLYCICQTPYDDSKFYIGCDVCADWLHGACVNITSEDAEKFEVYVCPRCSTEKKQEFLNKPITGDTRKKLLNLIDQLLSHKMSWPFQKPVDVKDVPNYYKIIKDPMDLTTLKTKVLSQKFKTICDFIRDVNKIFNNCRQFNAIDSTFAQCANVVDNYFRQLLENLMVKDH